MKVRRILGKFVLLFTVSTMLLNLVLCPLTGFGNAEMDNHTTPLPKVPRLKRHRAAEKFENLSSEDLRPFRNMPMKYLFRRHHPIVKPWIGIRCGAWPLFSQIKVHNTYWQQVTLEDGRLMFLLAAYYDNRAKIGDSIYILLGAELSNLETMTSDLPKFGCRMYFNGITTPVFVEAYTEAKLISWIPKNVKSVEGHYLAHHVQFQIPQQFQDQAPIAVSVVEYECQVANNLLTVHNFVRPFRRKGLGVCVKAMYFPYDDKSLIMAEWIEAVLAIGVEKIHIYYTDVTDETLRILTYYENLDLVELNHIFPPNFLPLYRWSLHQHYQSSFMLRVLLENFVMQDCVYRNMFTYEYITIIDIDELIMPSTATNWHDMLEQVAERKGLFLPDIDAFLMESFLFHSQSSEIFNETKADKLPIVSRDVRTRVEHGENRKIIYKTETVKIVSSHEVVPNGGCVDEGCKKVVVMNPSVGKLNHYREFCFGNTVENWNQCLASLNDTVIDRRIGKFRERILKGIRKALK